MVKKIKPGVLPQANSKIVPGKATSPVATINFSFKYIDPTHDKFCFSAQEPVYFCKVLERLKNLSEMTAQEFKSDRGGSLKSHSIDWRHTSEPEGFQHLNEQFQSYTPYQFAISRNEHGRIHGFFIGDIFHVVWLDPGHLLYPGK